MQGTQVRSLVMELDPKRHQKKKKKTPHAATKTWRYSQINKLKYLKKKKKKTDGQTGGITVIKH